MKNLVRAVALVLATTLGAPALHSEDFEMAVDIDDATMSDAKMVSLFLNESADGTGVPRSVRGLVMQMVGEVETAVKREKVDENGFIQLDDGRTVSPSQDDSIAAILNDPFSDGASVSVLFMQFPTPSGIVQTRPCGVHVCTPSGESIVVRIPPNNVIRGPVREETAVCKVSKCKAGPL